MPAKFLRNLRQGDVLRIEMSGSGGHGDPLARDPLAVLEDLRQGKVTPEGALRDYGVVVDPSSLELDEAATAARRAQRDGKGMAKG